MQRATKAGTTERCFSGWNEPRSKWQFDHVCPVCGLMSSQILQNVQHIISANPVIRGRYWAENRWLLRIQDVRGHVLRQPLYLSSGLEIFMNIYGLQDANSDNTIRIDFNHFTISFLYHS